MELYAKIITDDKRFERMLSLELSRCGIDIVSDMSSLTKKLTKENFFTVVDLDFCKENISELSRESKVIGFSYLYESELGKRAENCHAFFHRPFLMSEFISIFYNGKAASHSKTRRSSRHSVHEKRDYLRIDDNEKCVTVGKEKIFLTGNEFKVMSLLYEKRGETVSRDEISALFGGTDSNLSDVYICMIRKKIDEHFGIKFLYTVRGKGYMIK